MHDLLHNLACPHCWQAIGIGGVGAFAVMFGAVRYFGNRALRGVGQKLRETLWNR